MPSLVAPPSRRLQRDGSHDFPKLTPQILVPNLRPKRRAPPLQTLFHLALAQPAQRDDASDRAVPLEPAVETAFPPAQVSASKVINPVANLDPPCAEGLG